MRYFLDISYNGAPFHGWQRQPGDISVQQTLEEALETILREPVAITGAGRTDAGVNARSMPAHFDWDAPLPSRFISGINALVRPDISVNSVRAVAPDAHARFDAVSRTYRYFATTHFSPFLRAFTWKAPESLDFDLMNKAASVLTTVRDFASFAKSHSDAKTTLCSVSHAEWSRQETDDVWAFEITADRFLRNMVRAIVGTLVEVGRHKLTVEGFSEIISKKDRCCAGTSMPANALFLWEVKYPF